MSHAICAVNEGGLVRWIILLAVACGAITIFFPFFWMAITSLKTAPEIQRVPLQIAPDDWFNFGNTLKSSSANPSCASC
jgi:ABC-type glycerol-3-phosphate transport system permease component